MSDIFLLCARHARSSCRNLAAVSVAVVGLVAVVAGGGSVWRSLEIIKFFAVCWAVDDRLTHRDNLQLFAQPLVIFGLLCACYTAFVQVTSAPPNRHVPQAAPARTGSARCLPRLTYATFSEPVVSMFTIGILQPIPAHWIISCDACKTVSRTHAEKAWHAENCSRLQADAREQKRAAGPRAERS